MPTTEWQKAGSIKYILKTALVLKKVSILLKKLKHCSIAKVFYQQAMYQRERQEVSQVNAGLLISYTFFHFFLCLGSSQSRAWEKIKDSGKVIHLEDVPESISEWEEGVR